MGTALTAQTRRYTAEEGYALCARLAESHYENFTVASWLLPREKRGHVYAVYAYCRYVDDLGDEYEGDRLAALDGLEREVRLCYDGEPAHPYLVALQQTIREHDIPIEPFLRLIEANRIDQSTKRHPTYEDLEHYCRHSADPVGRLVLYLFGYRDAHRQTLSDYTCTALQLTNFWQDVSRDYAMGRIYIPLEDMERFGYSEEMLAERKLTPEFRDMMAFEVDRARGLFQRGLELVPTLDGRIKLDIALFSLGGMRILDAIERQEYDVLSKRPVLSKGAKMGLMVRTALNLWVRGRVQ